SKSRQSHDREERQREEEAVEHVELQKLKQVAGPEGEPHEKLQQAGQPSHPAENDRGDAHLLHRRKMTRMPGRISGRSPSGRAGWVPRRATERTLATVTLVPPSTPGWLKKLDRVPGRILEQNL